MDERAKMRMRQQTCCFTGHRHIPDSEKETLTAQLEETIMALYERGVRFYGAGGALGFDTLAAEAVLRLKPKCPGLRLILVLPCRTQTRGWRPKDIARYNAIKARADKVVYTSNEYSPAVCTSATDTWWTTAACVSATRGPAGAGLRIRWGMRRSGKWQW